MQEMWSKIPNFPNYSVSSFGDVYNHRTERMMTRSKTLQGDYKVTMINERQRITRSVRVLVAEAFVEAPNLRGLSDNHDEYPECDTVIVLDGDKNNVIAENLAWRPHWFALSYARQFSREYPDEYRIRRIANVSLGIYYVSILQAGVREGVLFEDVYRSAKSGTPVYPTLSRYEFQ